MGDGLSLCMVLPEMRKDGWIICSKHLPVVYTLLLIVLVTGPVNPSMPLFRSNVKRKQLRLYWKSINGQKAILVGHSSGASVALQIALDYPEGVGGLLLLAGAFDPDLEEANWFQTIGTLNPVSRLLSRVINNANRELLGLKRELQAQTDRLDQIKIPICAVHGDMDPLVPLANLSYLQRKVKQVSIDKQVLKYADHFIVWHSKPTVDSSLTRLIDQVRQTEPGQRMVTSSHRQN